MQKLTGNAPQRAKILPPTLENIALAASALQRDEVVGMPTETVYGLAGNAFSPLALTRIFETKERPTFDPLIIHVGPLGRGTQQLERLHLIDGSRLTDQQRRQVDLLIQKFWPGPLTLILPKHANVPDLATSGLSTVAIRMPQHPIAQALIASAQTPLAAPSANRFGRISPTTAQAVLDELGDRIDWILDGGPCQIGVESTILGFSDSGEAKIYRPGGASIENIEKLLNVNFPNLGTSPSPSQILSPGMLESHYAPSKPFRILPKPVLDLTQDDLINIYSDADPISPQTPVGLLLMSGNPEPASHHLSHLLNRRVITQTLSSQGNLQEIAHRLFAQMRALDQADVGIILSEPCPNPEGLGHAIMDRMKRAGARNPAKSV